MRRVIRSCTGLAWGLAAVAAPGLCLAQAASGEVDASRIYMSVMEMYQKGGWVMHILSAMSVLAVALIIYLFVVLRPENVVPRIFRKDILAKILAGDMEDVRTACNYRPCPLAEIALVGLDFVESSPQADPNLLKDVMQSEGERQALAIQGPTQYLLDVAVIAPMVGLFGTVLGMMQSFQVVALDIAKAKPMLLANGVSMALITTAFGLIVGIPSMMFYSYFRGRATKLVSHLESASGELLNALLRKRSA